MSSSAGNIQPVRGSIRPPTIRRVPLPRELTINDRPIAVMWSLYGRASDLVLVQQFAERIGVSVSWGRPKAGSVVIAEGKEGEAEGRQGESK
jgi:hypothetical protein